VPVPANKHAAIIGKKGATLQMIQQATGCKITVPKKESGQQYITIESNDQLALRKAKKTILDLINKGFSDVTHPGRLSADIVVPEKSQGKFIGKGGEIRRTIERKANVKITVSDISSSSNLVSIAGEAEGVALAKAAIEMLVEFGYSDLTHDGWVRSSIVVPAEYLGAIMGSGGSTIRRLQDATNTRINVPRGDDGDATVTIVGEPGNIEAAKLELDKLMVPKEVELPPEPTAEWGGLHNAGIDMTALHSWDDE